MSTTVFTSPVNSTTPLSLPIIIPSGSPQMLNASQSPLMLPMTPDSPITPIISPIPSIQSTLAMLPPMLSIIPSTKETDSAHADLPATLPMGHVNVIALQKELELYQNGYWSLKDDFDKVCDIIKATPSKEQMAQKLQEKDDQINRLTNQLKAISSKQSGKAKAMQNLHISLEKEVKNLKYKVKQLEMDRNENNIKTETLQELYMSPSHIANLQRQIKKCGQQFGTLKKRQYKLTQCIGKEKIESIKVRMGALCRDITATEASYNELFSCLDVMKTESEGKELELITKDKAYIELLEKEKLVQSEYMEDYVKKNQTLQAALTDREMKLRQCQNKLDRIRHLNGNRNGRRNSNGNGDALPKGRPTLGHSHTW